MKNSLVICALISFVLVFAACKNDPPPEPPDGSECDSITASYIEDIVPIMALYCNDPNYGNCHQAGALQGELLTYSGVKLKVDNGTLAWRIWEWRDMPPTNSGGPTVISSWEQVLIDCWLNQGAPDN